MEQSPSWEAKGFSTSQEFSHLLRNPKFHCRIHRWFPCEYFVTIYVFRGRVAGTSPNTQAGGPALVGYPRMLIQYIRSYCPYWRPFLNPQPEDAPCRGDGDPIITENITYYNGNYGTIEHIEDGWRRFAFLYYNCARRMTQICLFNTRLFSLHNKLNYAINRACLRMVLLTDIYRNLTSLWIKL